MKLTPHQIVKEWVTKGINISGIERALGLPFGSLMVLGKQEGQTTSPELNTLLNMMYLFPELITVADNNFIEEPMETDTKAVYESAIKQLTKTLDDLVGHCTDDGFIVAPTRRDLYYARGCLPVWCKNTLIKKEESK